MKVALFDSILERHLSESLGRAFKAYGADVYATDLLVHGHEMISRDNEKKIIWEELEKVKEFGPDLFISFRPMNLLPEMLDYINKFTQTAIWLSDDPVLYKTCYQQVVDKYSIVLHCGSEKVISFYINNGHKHGVNFPFWTDHEAFPYVYDPIKSEFDLIFLGNMSGQVRGKRYGELSALNVSKKVFGSLDSDPLGMHGGFIKDAYLNCDLVSETLKKFKVAISIPQFFSEYKGLHYDFTELSSLGYFQYPSRIIQYIASGIPVASVGAPDMSRTLKSIHVGESIESLKDYIHKVSKDYDFAKSESIKVVNEFRAHYTSFSRAKFLLSLLNDLSSIRRLTVMEKADLFYEFSSTDYDLLGDA